MKMEEIPDYASDAKIKLMSVLAKVSAEKPTFSTALQQDNTFTGTVKWHFGVNELTIQGQKMPNEFNAEEAAVTGFLNLIDIFSTKLGEVGDKAAPVNIQSNARCLLQTLKLADDWPFLPFGYETDQINEGFQSSVNLVFREPRGTAAAETIHMKGSLCRNKKLSIESVAQQVIEFVNGMKEDHKNEDDLGGSPAADGASPNPKTELSKKFGAAIRYDTMPSIGGYFQSKVLFRGVLFEGIPCRNKRLAEINVAEKVLEHFSANPAAEQMEEGEVAEEIAPESNPKADLNLRVQYRFPNRPPKFLTFPTPEGFVCTVSFGDGETINESHTGEPCRSKKLAEHSAARIALEYMRNKRARNVLRSAGEIVENSTTS